MRFYKRGRHVEQLEVKEWFGLRRREVEIEVFDDIVLVVAMKSQAEIGSRRELRILKRRKIIPGTVLLKYFRNIACGDLYALFPNARVVMSNFDKAFSAYRRLPAASPSYSSSTPRFPSYSSWRGFIWADQGRLKTPTLKGHSLP